MNKYKTSIVALALSVSVNQAHAAFAFSGLSGAGTVEDSTFFADKVFGYDFTVGVDPIQIDALGYFDQSGTGLDFAARLGIYPFDTDGPGGSTPSLLVDLSVAAAQVPDATDGSHSFFNIPAGLVLTPGARYRLVVTTGTNAGLSDHNTVPGPAVLPTGIDSAITIHTDGDFFSNAAGGSNLAYPTLELGPAGFDSPLGSLQFTVIPEPSSSCLLGLAALGLIGRRRR